MPCTDSISGPNLHFQYAGRFTARILYVISSGFPLLTAFFDRIETQDALFNQPKAIQRYVELGPAKVLSTMAEKTAKRKFWRQDASRAIDRRYLSYNDDTKAIYYEYDDNTQIAEEESRFDLPIPQPPQVEERRPTAPLVTPTTKNSPTGSAAPVIDVPLSALDIILTLTAQKLKRAFDEVPLQKSLRELSGGKDSWIRISTVQQC